jgi:two-component system phosphoglycerate transport system response regulator PgtA
MEHVSQDIIENNIDQKHTFSHPEKNGSPCSNRDFNILIVDDDTDILECYKLLFEYEGYRIETVSTPNEAIQRAGEIRFNLAILDYTLPNMRGDELALRLLETNDSMKLVFISGYNDAKTSILNKGLNIRFFMKPVDPDFLLWAARSVLNGSDIIDVEALTVNMA